MLANSTHSTHTHLFKSSNICRTAITGLFSTFLLIACASDPPPAPKMELQAAEQAISNAEQGRVAQFSPLEMKEAREKLSLAKDAVQEEKMPEAKRLAEQSRAVAELAVAKSEAKKAKQENEEIIENIETLKEEMQRHTGGLQ